MATGDFRPVYHPAGHDHPLRVALQDLRTGRWLAMRNLLESTPDWALWTQRTQVLAAVAAGSDAVHAWLAEEPRSVAATVMHARVAVERAVRAHREKHPRAQELWQEAWEGCRSAAHASPADPVPWVCLLALSQLDEGQRLEEHRLLPPGPMLFPGPWGLLAEADKRDPCNREAYHRMLQFVYARSTGGTLSEAVNFVQWAAVLGARRAPRCTCCRCTCGSSATAASAATSRRWTCTGSPRTRRATPGARCTSGSSRRSRPADLAARPQPSGPRAVGRRSGSHDAARVFRGARARTTPSVPWAYRTRSPQDADRCRGGLPAGPDPLSGRRSRRRAGIRTAEPAVRPLPVSHAASRPPLPHRRSSPCPVSASTPSSTEPTPHTDEEQRLRELGYQPVLARRMGGFGNFAISFSVISILSGCMTLYGFGMVTGGPAVMLWGWAGVGLFVLCVGMALAEVTSAYPTSGALYYMADRLGGRQWGWYTGLAEPARSAGRDRRHRLRRGAVHRRAAQPAVGLRRRRPAPPW